MPTRIDVAVTPGAPLDADAGPTPRRPNIVAATATTIAAALRLVIAPTPLVHHHRRYRLGMTTDDRHFQASTRHRAGRRKVSHKVSRRAQGAERYVGGRHPEPRLLKSQLPVIPWAESRDSGLKAVGLAELVVNAQLRRSAVLQGHRGDIETRLRTRRRVMLGLCAQRWFPDTARPRSARFEMTGPSRVRQVPVRCWWQFRLPGSIPVTPRSGPGAGASAGSNSPMSAAGRQPGELSR